ncbi:MAG: hypothetical protein GEV05_17445 [Betaproteobacteria bacterium]|nr:hypothetical protein [Betaproteobacteria bacterium]
MAEGALCLDDIRRMAAEIGLTHLTQTHLEELLRATQASQKRRAKLPIDELVYADEPAHVFSLDMRGVP